MPELDCEISRDGLLGGRVTILQPAGGYRTAIDPVLLAAAVPVQPGETVLDAGSGTGAAALALAARLEGVGVVGLDSDPGFIGLARNSAEESGLSQSIRFVEGDLLSPPPDLVSGSFDHVMANPPYRAAGSGNPPADAAKRAATVESRARLDDWLRFLLAMARAGGTVTVIHRYDRKDEVITGLGGEAGGLVVFPLWPKIQGQAAKRVIIQARKGKTGKTRITEGLVLHNDNGSYTAEAEAVLRGAGSLVL